jgi:hypothetical protein
LARIVRAEAAAISHRLIAAQDDHTHARAEAERDASYRAGFDRPHTLREQVIRLYKAMTDTRDVRELMSELDSHWLDAAEDHLFDAAEARLADLERQLAEQESHELAAHRGLCSIPQIEHALNLSRYETSLHRQLSRALNELDLIQRRRAGDPVPPPLNITITDAS